MLGDFQELRTDILQGEWDEGMSEKIYKNKKILYVCFENRRNILNLSFCIVLVNALKNNQCFDEMARKYC